MREVFLLLIICATAFVFSPAQAEESITITTYYPSPYGVYGVLRLFPSTKTEGSVCQEGEMYYEQNGTPTRPRGMYFCDSSNQWKSTVSSGSAPQFEFGGMYENGENEWGGNIGQNCTRDGLSSGSNNPSRCPCCETGNPLNGGRCGCPTGFTSTCMEMTDEPVDTAETPTRRRYDEYCYCYKRNY